MERVNTRCVVDGRASYLVRAHVRKESAGGSCKLFNQAAAAAANTRAQLIAI